MPCNNCEICDGISAGNDVDVLEIDGASNRGIDDIRSLRANVNVRSMRTQFKLYIIDEVHMLTREAFNALLKTLEEPPPNVKFVFCTTEPNKVPDTILSRCQRFDFSAIGEDSIGVRLKEIAAAEGFTVEDEAIELVARRARGSMRDSQSLFDQLLAFSDGTVTAEDVHRMLGTASDEMLVSMFEAITQHRPGDVLNILETALAAGVQAGELLDQCVGYVRDQMVTLSAGATASLCSVGAARRVAVAQQAQTLGMPNIMAAFQILSEAKGRIMRSTFARVLLEMALVQISMLENLTAISGLLSGQLPALPTADNAQIAGVTAAPAAIDNEKKNPEVVAKDVADTAPAAPETGPVIEFSAGNADRLLAEIISETAFTLSSAMKSVESIAISGPNGLEIRLGATYDFQKRVIEQTESRSAIQSIVNRLTGVDPLVTLQVGNESRTQHVQPEVPSERPRPAIAPKTSETHKDSPSQVRNPAPLRVRDDIDPEQDAFVQQVVATFGAKIVRVTDAPARKDISDEEN